MTHSAPPPTSASTGRPWVAQSYLDLLSEAAATNPSARKDRRGRPIIEVRGVVVEAREHRGHFCTGKIRTDSARGEHTHTVPIKGTLQVEPGGVYAFRGVVDRHEVYGESLLVVEYERVRPVGEEGIRRYLCSGLFAGVGAVRALAIVEAFGERALEVLEAPDAAARLCKIESVGKKTAESILAAYRAAEGKADREVLPKLLQWGLSGWAAGRIISTYAEGGGRDVLAVLRDDPYQIARDVDGIGFLTADRLALRMGLDGNDIRRARAASLYALEELAAGKGDTIASEALLADIVQKELRIDGRRAIDGARAMAAVVELDASGREAPGGGTFALRSLWNAECKIEKFVLRCAAGTVLAGPGAPQRWDAGECTQEQVEAVERILRAPPIAILTGGPGRGKTYTLAALWERWRAADKSVALCAPTGKAAIRMRESVGDDVEAKTIHRLLEFHPAIGFRRNKERPIEESVVVVDESSMVDVRLAAALVDAIDTAQTQLLLVGDADQIPSVGPGRVFGDAIESGRVPVCRLTRVMRQAEGSAIIKAADAVLRKEIPTGIAGDDLRWIRFENEASAEKLAETVVGLVARWIPTRLGIEAITGVQVLSPTHKGPLGCDELNRRLQAELNPPCAEKPETKSMEGVMLRLGDRVIQTKNNYRLMVFNGETGIIVGIEQDEKARIRSVVADYGGGRVLTYRYPDDSADLRLAYAITVHKSQGSEFPVVVMPIHQAHTFLWSKQLLYTALTRASRLLICVYTDLGVRRAVRGRRGEGRHTVLGMRLQRGAKS